MRFEQGVGEVDGVPAGQATHFGQDGNTSQRLAIGTNKLTFRGEKNLFIRRIAFPNIDCQGSFAGQQGDYSYFFCSLLLYILYNG